MSIWTHVAGTIRFDALRAFGAASPQEWIGPTNLWEEDNEDSTIPAGSEGSLDYSVIENPMESCLAAYAVCIFGDLRDYDDVSAICAWLQRITKGRMVRQGVVTIGVEGSPARVFEHDPERGEWTERVPATPPQGE